MPDDGCYYVLLQGEIKGRFRQKRQAESLYKSLFADSGYQAPEQEPRGGRNETVERYLDDLESYWLDSHKHARRGGKGRY